MSGACANLDHTVRSETTGTSGFGKGVANLVQDILVFSCDATIYFELGGHMIHQNDGLEEADPEFQKKIKFFETEEVFWTKNRFSRPGCVGSKKYPISNRLGIFFYNFYDFFLKF